MSAPLDPARLPDLAASTKPDSRIFLVGIDPSQPDFKQRRPVQIGFLADGGPLGGKTLLSILPLQGAPLRPNTMYAAVALRKTLDAGGRPLSAAPEVAQLAAGR